METKQTKQFRRRGSKGEVYILTLKFLMESKQIYWIDCTCPNFCGVTQDKEGNPKWIGSRRIKEHGEFADKKYYAEPCKHLKPLIDFYERVYGFTLKKPKKMYGTDKPTAALRKSLHDRSNGLCEANCGRPGLEIHRKVPRTNGGKYNEENCVLLCTECHQAITYQPWQSSPGAKK